MKRLVNLISALTITVLCFLNPEERVVKKPLSQSNPVVSQETVLSGIENKLRKYELSDSSIVFMKNSPYKSEAYCFDSEEKGANILILGGIHGDEDGSYTAPLKICASLEVYKGKVIVIPKANIPAIDRDKRYVVADLNRQFGINDVKGEHPKSNAKSPEYDLALALKQYIIDEDIDVFVNLHEGSKKWAQTFPYDSEVMTSCLEALADSVNKELPGKHYFKPKLEEMPGSATYFGANELGVLSFGVETSKSFPTEYSTYLHELVIYSVLNKFGVESNMKKPVYMGKELIAQADSLFGNSEKN